MLVRHLADDRAPLLAHLPADHVSNDHLVLLHPQPLLLSFRQLHHEQSVTWVSACHTSAIFCGLPNAVAQPDTPVSSDPVLFEFLVLSDQTHLSQISRMF